jgi:hypothetical protein
MHGDDELRLGGVLFDLLAQSGDVIVNRSSEGEVIITPDFIQQLIARDCFATPRDEVSQNLEFAR